MAFINSPLFQEASRQIQASARRQFRSTDMGRLLAEVEQARRGSDPAKTVQRAIQRFGAGARPNTVLKQMMGSEFGGLCRTLQRYSQGGSASTRAVVEFLGSLGPAGKLIQSLINPAKTKSLQSELQTAMGLIRSFGGEVIPGPGSSLADVERGYRAALKKLQDYGFAIVSDRGPPKRTPEPEEGRSTIDVEMGYRKGEREYRRVPADHPLLTGEMVQCPNSTNVYEFGYDSERGYLYVRFQQQHKENTRGGAGSLYRYSGVSPGEFLALYRVRNQGHGDGPGVWVWDALRIRGTVSGHQKDYELVGITDSYVPRKATVKRTKEIMGKRGKPLKRKGLEEWYVQREVKTHEGRFARSALPTTRVMPARGPR